MKYAVDFSFLEKFVKRYPMMPLDSCVWAYSEDYFFSKNQEDIYPFSDGEAIVHRVEANLDVEVQDLDTEKFLELAKKFLSDTFTSFENKRHIWLFGKPGSMDGSEVSNGPFFDKVLHKAGYAEYFKSTKLVLAFPFGEQDVCFVVCGNKLYFDTTDVPDINSYLENDFDLSKYESTNKTWAEISYEEIKKNV